MLTARGSRPLLIGAGAVVVSALVLAAVVLLRQPAAAAPDATLSIYAGTVQVQKAGTSSFAAAVTGHQLSAGDTIQTGPQTKAAITFADGSITRMDSSTTLSITKLARATGGGQVVELRQDAGKTWNKVAALLGQGQFRLRGPNNATAEVRGTVFSVIVEKNAAGQIIVRFNTWQGSIAVIAGGQTVVLPAGLSSTVSPTGVPSQPAPIPPGDLNDFWTVFNQTADTSVGAPATLASNTLDAPSSTPVQVGPTADGRTDFDFALGWPGSKFELTVFDPDGHEYQTSSSATPPVHISVPSARSGTWTYQVRDIQSGPKEVWWVIVSKVTPSRQAPSIAFTSPTPCDHTVSAGQVDSWQVAARSSANRPTFTAGALPAFGTIADGGDGTATLTFRPPDSAGGADTRLTITASSGGTATTLECTEHIRALRTRSTIAGHIAGPGPGVRVTLDPVGSTATTDSAGTFQFTDLAAGQYTVRVTAPSGYIVSGAPFQDVVLADSQSVSVAFTLGAQPAITAVAPNQGVAAGGTAVNVSGVGFSNATSVLFGGAPATSFSVLSDTQLSAVSPPQAAGLVVDVRVSSAYGASNQTASDRFSYLAPLTVQASSNAATTAPGGVVQFAGVVSGGATPYNLLWDFGDGNTGIDTPAFHAYTAGGRFTVVLTVRDGIGQSAGSSGLVINVGPGLNVTAAASAAQGSAPLSTTLTAGIGGGSPPYQEVWSYGDGSATSSGLSVAHVYAVPGAYRATVTVTDSSGSTSTATTTVTAAPSITGLAPPNGPLAGATSVSITGTGFTGATAVSFGATTAASFQVLSDTSLTAVTRQGPAAGTFDAYVTTNGVISPPVAADRFTYLPPPGASGTTLAATPAGSVYGQSVTITATVVPVPPATGSPSGAVTFYDAAVSIGSGTLSGSTAFVSTSALSVGSHSLTATYAGDSNFTSSASAATPLTTSTGPTTTSLVSSGSPSNFGSPVTFTANVSVNPPAAGVPTGNVSFSDGSTVLGTGPLTGGSATLTTSTLAAGTHSNLTAAFSGDVNFATSTSLPLVQVVSSGAPAVAQINLSASPAIISANGVATSNIIASAVDAFGVAANTTSPIVVALTSNNSACCRFGAGATTTTTIPAGSSDNTAAPAVLTSTNQPGSATVSGSATGLTVASTTVTTTTRSIGLPAEVLAPPGSGIDFPITVNPAAPGGGLLVTLNTLNGGVATVTASVTIPAGATTANATLTGVSAGQTTLSASAPNYASNSTLATVKVINISFSPSTIRIPLTRSDSVQAVLSAAAPIGGLQVNLAVAPAGVAGSPAFVIVPGGQLQSPAFSISTVAQGGPVTLTGTSSVASSGTMSVWVDPPPAITLNNPYYAIGAGGTRALSLSLNTAADPAGLVVNLASSDPTTLTVPGTVTVPGGATYVSYDASGLKASAPATSVTITATASGWVTGTTTSTVVISSLSIAGLATARTTLDPPNPFTLSVQNPSCGYSCDQVSADTVVTINLTTTPVSNVTAPASLTIKAGLASVNGSVSTALQAGSYSLGASVSAGTFTASNSATVNITQPSVTLNNPYYAISAGMYRNGSVQLSNAAPPGGLVINLTSSDTRFVTVPATVTVLSGLTTATYPITGVQAGPANITGASAGWSVLGTAVTVNTAQLSVSGLAQSRTTLDPANTFTVSIFNPSCGYSCDLLLAPKTVNLSLTSTIATVLPTLTLPIDGNQASGSVSQATGQGTYTVSASDPSGVFGSGASVLVTVTQPSITLNQPYYGIGSGMHRQVSIQLSNPAANGLTISLGSSDPTTVSVPPTATVAPGSNYTTYTVTALKPSLPSTSVTITGTAAGWTPGSTTAVATTAQLTINGLGSSRTTLDPANPFYVYVYNPSCGYACDSLNADTAVNLSLTSSATGVSIPATVTVLANTSAVGSQASPATGPGSYTITASDPIVPSRFTSGTSPTVTVTQPSITIGDPYYAIGVGAERTVYVNLSNAAPATGLTVNLGSTSPTVVAVPATVFIAADATAASFTARVLSTPNTTVTVTASAPGWSGSSIGIKTTTDLLAFSGLVAQRTTLDAAEGFTVSVQNPSCGYSCDVVSADTVVSLAAPGTPPGIVSVPATLTIPAGSSSISSSATAAAVTGSYKLTASAPSFFAPAQSATVTVVAPYITVNATIPVMAGGNRTLYLNLSNPAPAGGLTVSLVSGTVRTGTVPASVLVPQDAVSASYTFSGIAPGSTNVSASATGWTTGTQAIGVNTPTFIFSNLVTSRTTGSPINAGVTVTAINPACGYTCDALNADITVSLTVAGTANIVAVTPTTVTIAAATPGNVSASFSVSVPATAGNYNVLANAPGYAQGTSANVVVT